MRLPWDEGGYALRKLGRLTSDLRPPPASFTSAKHEARVESFQRSLSAQSQVAIVSKDNAPAVESKGHRGWLSWRLSWCNEGLRAEVLYVPRRSYTPLDIVSSPGHPTYYDVNLRRLRLGLS